VRARIRFRALRYGVAFSGPLIAYMSITGHGLACWSFALYGFFVIPLIELMLRPGHSVLSEEEEHAALADPIFDLLLYAVVPVQWGLMVLFLFRVNDPGTSPAGSLPWG
jgi:alkane 1-monooxygenase